MNKKIPTFPDEYIEWLVENHGYSTLHETYYKTVTEIMKANFISSDFWQSFTSELNNFDAEYYRKTGYPLFRIIEPEIQIKPFDSFILKTYRKNILYNNKWPDAPSSNGWITPDNWYSRVNDTLRTIVEVKYLDGVKFLISKTDQLCKKKTLNFEQHLEARDEGYYAAHMYIGQKFEIPDIKWDTKIISTNVEIQITTQIQEVIRKLLHQYYEDNRTKTIRKEKEKEWAWNYQSDEFSANYLGHILHYLEGIIINLRDKQKQIEE